MMFIIINIQNFILFPLDSTLDVHLTAGESTVIFESWTHLGKWVWFTVNFSVQRYSNVVGVV